MESRFCEAIKLLQAVIFELHRIEKEEPLNATDAYKYLGISRTAFYKDVRPKLKGVKRQGDKMVGFTKKELDNFR